MKRKLALGLILVFMLSACASSPQTATTAMETVVISYEGIGFVAFPNVKVYLERREANGSLSGEALVRAKAQYALAKRTYISAGDMMVNFLSGSAPINYTTFNTALQQIAVILADLSGGKVEGNKLTIPKK